MKDDLVKIHSHPVTLMHTQTSQPGTNTELESHHGKKDKKHLLFYSSLAEDCGQSNTAMRNAQLHKPEKDKPTSLSLGYFQIFFKVASQSLRPLKE